MKEKHHFHHTSTYRCCTLAFLINNLFRGNVIKLVEPFGRYVFILKYLLNIINHFSCVFF